MSPVSTKIQQTRQRLAALEGEHLPVFEETALQAIPVQVGGLHPITDLWYIERSIDTPKSCDSTSLTWWKKLPLSSAPRNDREDSRWCGLLVPGASRRLRTF